MLFYYIFNFQFPIYNLQPAIYNLQPAIYNLQSAIYNYSIPTVPFVSSGLTTVSVAWQQFGAVV